jgi:hypothetical protein
MRNGVVARRSSAWRNQAKRGNEKGRASSEPEKDRFPRITPEIGYFSGQ